MQSFKRIFVEKKPPFAAEANELFHDLKTHLQIQNLNHVRLLNRYLITNIDQRTYNQSLASVFSEPQVDYLYEDRFVIGPHVSGFAVTYLPGQYDQRADSAQQCIKLLNPRSQVIIQTAKVVILEGKLTKEELQRIKKYYINTTDSCEVDIFTNSLHQPVNKVTLPKQLVGFSKWNLSQLQQFSTNEQLAMSMNDLLMVQTYFCQHHRQPTITEIKVIDTYWSDHCRHTTFLTNIQQITIANGKYNKPIIAAYQDYLQLRDCLYRNKTRPITLMDLATIVAKSMRQQKQLADLDVSEEINACSISIDVMVNHHKLKYFLMFKNETHNHPTEIEPYGGAATCLGGAIRDPLSGRSYVYQAMRVTGAADPTASVSKTLAHKLPQRTICINAARGFSAYGNQIGLATGQVDEIYHPQYVAKRLEIGAVIGAVPQTHVKRLIPQPTDVVILIGGRTGKDGVGGASGSSKIHDDKSTEELGAQVQKGNPITERKIQRLFLNPKVTKLIKRCNDFGAGGICVAVGELCPGLDIDLSVIPVKYIGLDATALAIAESQERMAVLVAKKDVSQMLAYAKNENLEATVIAKVTSTNHLRMFYQKQCVVDIDRDFLNTNGAVQYSTVKIAPINKIVFSKTANKSCTDLWKKMLVDLNVCAKHGLIQRFGSTIGCGTVLMPLGGKYQLTPAEGMVGIVPTFTNMPTTTASMMSYGFNPYISDVSSFHMGYYSVIEAVSKIVAMGGDYKRIRLSLQEYFPKLTNSQMWGNVFSGLLGAYWAQRMLTIPAIGGKDSMSGSFKHLNVPGTIVTFAVNTIDATAVISSEFKQIGSTIAVVLPKYHDDLTIDINTLTSNFNVIHQNIKNKKIIAAYALKQQGIAAGLSKMAIGNKIGVIFHNVTKEQLFALNYGGIIVEIPPKYNPQTILKNTHYQIIGKTIKEPIISNKALGINLPVDEIVQRMLKPLSNVYTYTTPISSTNNCLLPTYRATHRLFAKKRVSKPLVIIPVFPGTNCEYDSQRAFERAGARVKQVLINNLSSASLNTSITALTNAIKQANIVMIPGGFSAGDEPDGSAKFIVNVFRNSKVKAAVNDLLTKRDGLMIGICNGFQALIKLGLVPYGKILDQPIANMPTLTFNDINHHMSGIARTKVISNKSPWLARTKVGEVYHVPFDHGEGKFIASPSQIKTLADNGQIVSQYVDLSNEPTMQMPFNPNGSCFAIEGICSSDGRVLGKMCHSERVGLNLYKNVIGKYEQQIFKCGVEYFIGK